MQSANLEYSNNRQYRAIPIMIGLIGIALSTVAFARPDVTLIGRFSAGDGFLDFAWPASSIGATFMGPTLNVRIEDTEDRNIGGEPAHNVYDVFIDGAYNRTFAIVTGISLYRAADGLAPGIHTVWLRKRTEAMVGSARFYRFEPTGEGATLLPPPAARQRRIEVIGASNEAGYGNMRSVTSASMCTFTSNTENALSAFPALVAEQLQADLVLYAYSGKGLASNFERGGDTMATLHRRTNPNVEDADNVAPEIAPDAVLIDLGGNDWANGAPDQKAFMGSYATLLADIRRQSAAAPIYVILNPMQNGSQRTEIQACLTTIVNRAHANGDANVHLMVLDEYTGKTYGCDYHPDAALHASIAATVTQTLRAKLGW